MAIHGIPPMGVASGCAPTRGHRPWREALGWFLGISAVSLAVGLIVPAYLKAREARERSRCVENLRAIGAALLQYERRWGTLPPAATFAPDGRPLLSWRVLILPELGHAALAREFRADEPWDSPHNRALLGRMPAVFGCPASRGEPGMTTYLGIHGPQALFEGREGVAIATVTDGTSQTLLIAESSWAAPWTKPVDHEYAPLNLSAPDTAPLPALGSPHGEGYNGVFGDGATRFLRRSLREETLRGIITRDGGEAIGEA